MGPFKGILIIDPVGIETVAYLQVVRKLSPELVVRKL